MARILFVEPFFDGSHKQLLDTLIKGIDFENTGYELFTLPGKKWHWRARTSALYFAEVIPRKHVFEVLFASSVLNLAELIALRPDLMTCTKILYFHENQLIYPVRKQQERDFQYGYNQIISCMVADKIFFNTLFNLNSFLDSIPSFFKLQPDHRPKNLEEFIRPKSKVLHFPILIQTPLLVHPSAREMDKSEVLHIVWPHRWEHDKGPEKFFLVIDALIAKGCNFRLSVLGEQFQQIPSIFSEKKSQYQNMENQGEKTIQVLDWGWVNRDRYVDVLSSAHVVVSTADHEFFGVSMIEAAILGCFPMCPLRLSYPEIFPVDCLYRTELQLIKKLKYFCKNPNASRNLQMNLDKFKWPSLKSQYEEILLIKKQDSSYTTGISN
ncbi:glycosyltransferase-like domain-containing protein 1 isoform X1 [Daphnia pulex]|uniref:glycosyltransferase-like domain-containing protein 1 isoform X1 n=1 Tax=Daphnia pulex TaxID=6669 RepID=UPI001EDD773C|nr:glycosyltransferase-like domain-containing protein 1 isoform X1 [Daphnia pulex]